MTGDNGECLNSHFQLEFWLERTEALYGQADEAKAVVTSIVGTKTLFDKRRISVAYNLPSDARLKEKK